jgi:hypothetical protein
MPKKTKKEKALAQARRIVQNARIQSSLEAPKIVQKDQKEISHTSTFQFKAKPDTTVFTKSRETDEQEFTAIRKDIIKTVIFASIAIAFEFVVYVKLG